MHDIVKVINADFEEKLKLDMEEAKAKFNVGDIFINQEGDMVEITNMEDEIYPTLKDIITDDRTTSYVYQSISYPKLYEGAFHDKEVVKLIPENIADYDVDLKHDSLRDKEVLSVLVTFKERDIEFQLDFWIPILKEDVTMNELSQYIIDYLMRT